MEPPDQRLFEADLVSAEFRNGAQNAWWGVPDRDQLPPDLVWPRVVIWVAPAVRQGSPNRFYLLLDAEGYRSVPPTGTFWDPSTKTALDLAKRPKGRAGSRCAMVFRTDWKNTAL